MPENKTVFISYSTKDNITATLLCNYLENKGINCWIAPRNIQVGIDYAQSIVEAIEDCSACIVILSEASNSSNHVKNEIERAFNNRVVILPFLIQNIRPNKSFEYFLSSTHRLDAYQDKPEKYFDILYKNCYSFLNKTSIKNTITNESKEVIETQQKQARKPYLAIGAISVTVAVVAAITVMTIRKSGAEVHNSYINLDSAAVSKSKSDTLGHTLATLPINKPIIKPLKQERTGGQKSVPEKSNNAESDNQIIPAAKFTIPEAIAGEYEDPDASSADNLKVTLADNKVNFNIRIKGGGNSGSLIAATPFKYIIKCGDIGGKINFSNDYSRATGTINYKKVKLEDQPFELVKK